MRFVGRDNFRLVWDKFALSLDDFLLLEEDPSTNMNITGSMGPTWGPSGTDRTQVGPMLAQCTFLSWYINHVWNIIGKSPLNPTYKAYICKTWMETVGKPWQSGKHIAFGVFFDEPASFLRTSLCGSNWCKNTKPFSYHWTMCCIWRIICFLGPMQAQRRFQRYELCMYFPYHPCLQGSAIGSRYRCCAHNTVLSSDPYHNRST